MKTTTALRTRKTARILAGSIAALLAAQSAHAVDFAWDPANDALGGSGNWTAGSGLLWDSGTTATGANTNIFWTNGVASHAYFGTTAGTVTLTTAITAGSLNFGVAGYIINTGANTLTLNSANTGTAGTINFSGGTLALVSDGDGTGSQQNVNFLENANLTSNGTITVGRLTAGVGLLNAANKTLQLGDLSIGANTLTVTNNNGYGLQFTGATTLTGAATFNVSGGSNAPVTQGLTLTGVVTGGFGITKSGAGTLVLSNASNSFGTGGSVINITGGLVSAASDGALGDSGNIISLNGGGLQLTGTGNYAHQINTTTSGVLDVTQGITATLTAAFNAGAANATALTKNGNGILNINVDNTANYTGVITVTAGAIRVSNAGALGATANNTTVSNNVGAAVQINGVTTAEAFNISSTGINTGGALQAVVNGTASVVTGGITVQNDATIGADSGATLNITTTAINGATAGRNLAFAGAGAINVGIGIGSNIANVTKINAGTTTFTALNAYTGTTTVNAGTLTLSGAAGQLKVAPGAVTVNPGGTLTLDNATSLANRLQGATLGLSGGTLNFTGTATTEAIGALTPSPGLNVINLAGTGTLSFASLGTRAIGGVVNITGSGPAVQFVATTTVTDGLLVGTNTAAAYFFGGTEFATSSGAANAPISAYTAATTGNFGAQASDATRNFKPTGTQTTVFSSKTINTLNLTAGAGVTIYPGQTLTLDAGGLINNGGGDITGGFLTPSAELIANYATNANISSIITSNGLTKTGAGNLTLSALNTYGAQTTINQGTLTLGGGNNTLTVNQVMVVNNGGTLALGANSQYVGNLNSTGAVEGSGGTITGSGTLTDYAQANRTFAGNISGSVNFDKNGFLDLTLTSASDTTGNVRVLGSSLTLKDGGAFSSATGGLTVNYQSTLTLDNTGTKDVADRINDSKTITLNGGTITYNGRANFNSTETLGATTLSSGLSAINVVVGGTGVNSAQLTLTSLARTTGAQILLQRNITAPGQIGSNPRIVVTAPLSGSLAPIGGVVPGVFSFQADLAGYTAGLGFGSLGTAGFPAYYTAALNAAASGDNVKLGATGAVLGGGQTINAINLNGNDITFTGATDTLTLASGMLVTGSGRTIGTTALPGILTSSTPELFLWDFHAGGTATLTVNSKITGSNMLVFGSNGSSVVALVPTNSNNNYTGGTVINGVSTTDGGTLTLNNAGGVPVIPLATVAANGLILNSATATMSVSQGQIASGNIVTLNGGGAGLTYFNSNTQAGFVFTNNGSTFGMPFVNASGVLTLTGAITSTPTAIITGGTLAPNILGGWLDLNNTGHNITVDGGATAASLFHAGNGAAIQGLIISSVIQNGSMTKLGTGVLQLSTANYFSGGLTISAGAVLSTAQQGIGNGAVTVSAGGALWLGTSVGTAGLNTFTLAGGTLASTAGNNTLAGNVNITADSTISLLDPVLNNTVRSLTISSIVTGAGTAGPSAVLTVNGIAGHAVDNTSILTLSSPLNTFGGAGKFITLNGGQLAVAADGALGNVNNGLVFNGGVLKPTAAFTMAATRGITINSGNAYFNTAFATTINGAIGGTGSLNMITGTSTLTLAGALSYGGGTVLNAGTLILNNQLLPSGTVTLNGGALTYAHDGLAGTSGFVGNGALDNLSNTGANVVFSGTATAATITVGKLGTVGSGANKTVRFGGLTFGGQATTLTVTNSNGYGLDFTGATTLVGAAPTFTVSGGSNAPIVQGLTLSGVVSGAFGFTKLGAGTMVLTNSGNTFGSASTITIGAGLVSVTSDGALGASNNIITLATAAGAGLQADGTFGTARRINTSFAGVVIDVTQGNTFTLNTTALNAGTANANAFSKNGNGIFEINVDNTANYTGVITVNAGAIRVSNAGALGAVANNTIVGSSTAVGAAVQINGVTTTELFTINNSGINSGGAIENFAGTGAVNGAITLASAATIGSTAGTLDIGGAISGAFGLTFSGAGSINLNAALNANVTGITKIGSGTTTIASVNTNTNAITINAGTFQVGSTTTGVGSTAGNLTVTPGATLTVNNTFSGTANRLGGNAKTVALGGATLSFIGSGATGEALGALTLNAGLSTVSTSGGTGILSFASQGTRNPGGVVNFSASGSTIRYATTAPTLADGIIGQGFFVGNDFATHTGNNTDVVAYAAYTPGDLGTVATTNVTNFKPDVAQTNVTANKIVNTLNLTGGFGTVIDSGFTLTLDAGGLINNGGGDITGGFLSTTSNAELVINNATAMNISSIISGTTGGLTKTGAGNLTLSGVDTYTGQTTINQGTLTLGGGNNTLSVNRAMVVNNGGTLALGANNQYVGNFTSTGSVEGSGGTVTGSGTLTTNAANGTFAGNISGSVNIVKAGANTLNLSSANSTTGTIQVIGGGLTLRDGGTLLLGSSGGITVNNAALTLDNNTGTKDMADRIKDDKAITLNAGNISYLGRAQFNSTESLGAVTLSSGYNIITATAGGTGVNSAQLTLASLTRTTGAQLFLGSGFTTAGLIGNTPRIVVTAALSGNLATIGGVVPGVYAQPNAPELVGYTTGLGFGALGTVGFPAYHTAPLAAATSTANVQLGGTGAVLGGGQTINAIALNNNDLMFAGASDTLTLTSGMLVNFQNHFIGTTALPGVLTSTAPELNLFSYHNGGSIMTVNSRITGSNMLVFGGSGSSAPSLVPTNINNNYTGGTVINGSATTQATVLTLNNAGGVPVIPNATDPTKGLILNNATASMTVSQGQIGSGNIVTLNGGSTMTYFGNNTVAGLVFNSNGGTTTPTVSPTGILTLTGGITSTPSNVAVTPIISAGTLDLNSSASHTFTVNAYTEGGITNGATLIGLDVSSVVQNGGFAKAGAGILRLSGANTYAGTTTVNAGILQANNAAAFGVNSAVTLANTAGAILDVNGLSVSIGSLTGGGGTGGNVTLGAGTLTVGTNHTSPAAYAGVISGTGALTKTGAGTQTLSGTSTYSGATTINGGTLRVTGSKSGTGAVTVAAGGALGGTGTVNGSVTASVGTAASAGGAINLSNDGGEGTLSLGGTLTFSGNATNPNNLSFDLGTVAGTNDLISATGVVTVTNAGGAVINLKPTVNAGTIGNGLYTLISGAAGSSTTNYVLATSAAFGKTFVLSSSGAGPVLEEVTVATAAAGPAAAFWSGASDATWSTAGNWNDDATLNNPAGAAPGVGTNVTFGTTAPVAGNLATSLGTDFEINNLAFADQIGNVTIAGANMLTIDGGLTLSNTAGTVASAISAKVGLGASQTWTIDNTGTASTLTVSGAITDFGSGFGLTKAGLGTLTLSGVNTFTGGVTLSAGTLNIGNASALGTSGTIAISGGTIDNTSGGTITTLNSALTLNGDFTFLGGTQSLNFGTANTTLGTAAGTSRQITVNANTLTIGGIIANGTTANSLVKAGAGTLTLNGDNTFTGSVTLSAGTLNLTGTNAFTGGVTLTAGTLNIGRFSAIGTGALVINGGTLNNTSGAAMTTTNSAVTIGGDFIFTGTSSLTLGIGTGATTLGGAAGSRIITANANTLTLSGAITDGTATGLTKAGGGTLVLNNRLNSYSGGTTLSAGTLTAQAIVQSLTLSNTVLGAGPLTLNAGTLNLKDNGDGTANAQTLNYANNTTVGGSMTITVALASGATAGTKTIQLGTLAIGAQTLTVTNSNNYGLRFGVTTLSGNANFSPSLVGSTTTGISSSIPAGLTLSSLDFGGAARALTMSNSGETRVLNAAANVVAGNTWSVTAGVLTGVDPASLGGANAAITLSTGALQLLNNGTSTGAGNGMVESISYGNPVTVSGGTRIITVGQFNSGAGGFGSVLNAANKTLQLGTLAIGALQLTTTNSNGFGLEFTGTTTLSGATASTFSVANASVSTAVPGLTLDALTSAVTTSSTNGAVILTKTGNGTLLIKGANAAFGGNGGATGQIIDITGGILAADSDAALGVAANVVRLNVNSTTQGFLATDTFSTARTFTLNQTSNDIEVMQGKTLTLTSVFGLGAVGNALQKNDNGVLEINANNATWTGALTVAAGAVKVSNAGALGTTAGATTVSGAGAAVQLNGVGTAENFTINGTGINTGGAIENISGTNALTGIITLGSAATIGSTSGTLNLSTAMVGTQALTLAGAGNINISAALPALTSLTQIVGGGSVGGAVNLSATSTAFILPLAVNAGTFTLSGLGQLGVGSSATVRPTGTLTLENSGTATSSRLGTTNAKTVSLFGAALNLNGHGATAVAESVGALTFAGGASTITSTNIGGNTTLTFSSLVARTSGATGNFVTVGGTNGTTNSIILTGVPVGFVDKGDFFNGADYAAMNSAGGFVKALVYDGTNSTAAAVNTITASTHVKLTATPAARVGDTLLSLNLTGAGVGYTMTSGALSVPAILKAGGGAVSTISGGLGVGPSNTEMVIRTDTAADLLTLSVPIRASFVIPLTKTGLGTLTLSATNNSYSGTTSIDQGTLILASGANNNPIAVNNAMVVNNGATLALGSNNQYINSLTSVGAVEGSGGNISGTGTLTSRDANGNFAGNIGFDGTSATALNFVRAGNNTLTLYSAQSTTGTLSVIGGGLTLKDGATLLGITGGLAIKNATLTIDNTGTKDLADRVNNSAITLDGGTIAYLGRAQFNSTESLGAVTLASGFNSITATAGGTNVNSAQLTLASLARTTGAQLFINNTVTGLIGNTPRIVVTAALSGNLAPIGGVVPGVIAANFELMGYTPGLGFGQLGQAGLPANYTTSATLPLAAAPASANIKFSNGLTDTVKSGGQTINALNLNESDLSFAGATDTLTLTSGMLINSRSKFIGTTALPGVLTSTAPELFLFSYHNGTSIMTVNSKITGANMLVFGGAGSQAASLFPTNLANNYTGGTVINGSLALLNLSTPGGVIIPNATDPTKGLILNNATAAMAVSQGQIGSANIVTLNGGSALYLAGNNTLAGLVFNSNGGTTTPLVSIAASNTIPATNAVTASGGGVLTLTGSITSTPTNVAVVPTISSGGLDLGGTSHTITVAGGATATSLFHAANGATVTGLTISSAIPNGGITKLGTGVLELSGINAFTGGLTVGDGTSANAGVVKVSTATALGGSGNVVTLNRGSLWLAATPAGGQTIVVSANGGTLAATAAASVDANIVLNGALTISLADPTLNNTDRSITFNSSVNGTLGISGAGSLVVSGNPNNNLAGGSLAALTMNQNTVTSSYTGGTTINSGGRISLNPSGGNLPNTNVPGSNAAGFGSLGSSSGTLTINTGGTLIISQSMTVGNFTGTGGTVINSNGFAQNLTIGNGNTGGGNFAGVLANATGTVGLIKVGTGTITLSGSSTATGGTTVNNGTLALDFTTATTAAPVLASTGVLTLGGGTLDLRNGVAQVQVVASTTLTGGLSNVTQSTGTSILRMNAITPGVGLVNFGAASIASTTTVNTAGILGAWATVAGADWAIKSGTVENGSNNYITAYSAYTDIDAQAGGASPNIVNGSTTNVRIQTDGVTGSIGLSAATTTVNTLLQNNATIAATVDTATGNLVTNGIMIGTGRESLTIGVAAGDGSLKTATVGALVLNNYNASEILTVNAPILVNSTSGLSSAGSVRLNGVNTYTGNTGVYTGTLEIGGAGQLNSGSYAGLIQISSGATLKVNTSAAQILSGVISGDGVLVKAGTGTTTVSGANTYTGLTTVNRGTLQLGVTNSIKSGNAVTVNSTTAAETATLNLNGFGQTVGTAGVSGLTLGGVDATATSTSQVIGTGAGSILTLAGTTAALTVDATGNPLGALISATTVSLNGAAQTLTIGDSSNATNDLTISSAVASGGAGGALIKAGAGVLKLDGAQSYNTLTANAGTTNVNGSLTTLTAAVSVSGAGTKLKFGSVSQTLGSLTIGAGSTVTFTSGTASGSFTGGDGGGKAPSFGGGGGAPGSAVVPEPGTLGLLLVGALGVLNRRRRA